MKVSAWYPAAVYVLLTSGCLEGQTSGGAQMRVEAVSLVTDSTAYDARDVRAKQGGGFWVLSNEAPFVKLYNADGVRRLEFGQHGRGPTDLIRPWRFLGEDRGDAPPLIWDVGRRALVSVDSVGRARMVLQLVGAQGAVRNDIERVTFGDPFTARLHQERIVLAQHAGDVGVTADMTRPIIMSVDLSSGGVDTIVRITPRVGRPEGSLMVALPLWDMCANESIAVFDGEDESITRIGFEGDTIQVIPLHLPRGSRRLFSKEDRSRYLRPRLVQELLESGRDTAEASAQLPMVLRDTEGSFPRHQPMFVTLLCDAVNRVWLQRFSLLDDPLGYGEEWVVVSPQGAQTAYVLPKGFRPSVVKNDEILGISEDSDGARYPSRARLSAAVVRNEE